MCGAVARCASRISACPFCGSKCMWCEHILSWRRLLYEVAHCAAPRHISHLPPPRYHHLERPVLTPSHRDSAWTQASSATLASVQLATSLYWRAGPGRIYGSCVVSFAPKTPLKLTPFLGGFSAPRPMGGTEVLSPTATWQSGPVSKSFSPVGTRPLDGCSNRNATNESQERGFLCLQCRSLERTLVVLGSAPTNSTGALRSLLGSAPVMYPTGMRQTGNRRETMVIHVDQFLVSFDACSQNPSTFTHFPTCSGSLPT